MADIQQWRRRFQHSSSRPSITISEVGDQRAKEEPASPRPTPKLKIKPKLSSYFSHHPSVSHASPVELKAADDYNCESASSPQSATASASVFGPPLTGHSDGPDVEQAIDGLVRHMYANPLQDLSSHHSNAVFTIIESYRQLHDELARLIRMCEREKENSRAKEDEIRHVRSMWRAECEDLKKEVKCLEVIIAKGQKGVGAVIEARQNSVLRKHSWQRRPQESRKETINEFLVRSRKEDEVAEQNHRARLKSLAISPSASMIELSRKMSANRTQEELSIHTPSILAGTLRERDALSGLWSSTSSVAVDVTAELLKDKRSKHAGDRKPSFATSSSAYSTFSSEGDALPDELDEQTIRAFPETSLDYNRPVSNKEQISDHSIDHKQITTAARNQHVESDISMSTWTQSTSLASAGSSPTLTSQGQKRFDEMKEVSPIFVTNNPMNVRRKFSFDPGDDKNFGLLPKHLLSTSDAVLSLRRSQSAIDCSSIGLAPQMSAAEPEPASGLQEDARLPVTPNPQAPVSSSLIPSPIALSPLARPRRDDSLTKHLTARKHKRDSGSSESKSAVDSLSVNNNQLQQRSNRSSAETCFPVSPLGLEDRTSRQPEASARSAPSVASAAARVASSIKTGHD